MATMDARDYAGTLRMAAIIIDDLTSEMANYRYKCEKLEEENKRLKQENSELKKHLTSVSQNNWSTK